MPYTATDTGYAYKAGNPSTSGTYNPNGGNPFYSQDPPAAPPVGSVNTPFGSFPDANGQRADTFQPQTFISSLLGGQAAQDYASPSSAIASKGVGAIRGGERKNIDKAKQEAAAGGLGRGFAQQQESDIRQQGTQSVAEVTAGAALEERTRRFQLASMLAGSLVEANKSAFTAYLAGKGIQAGSDAAGHAETGAIIGGGLAAAGGILDAVL